MSDLTNSVARKIGSHFVTLSCVQYLGHDDCEKTLVFSGFIVDVMDEWFYITAGHVLKDIQSALAAGYRFDVWRLGDQTAGNKFNNTAIPYDFVLDDWIVIEDAEIGVDYAAVHLGGIYRLQL